MVTVTKRDGSVVNFDINKTKTRIQNCLDPGTSLVWLSKVLAVVESGVVEGMSTADLDPHIADSYKGYDFNYSVVAARVFVSHVAKSAQGSFSEKSMMLLENQVLSEAYGNLCKEHAEALDSMIDYERDYLFDYMGIRMLADKYLLRCDGKIVERPQDMLLRVALNINSQQHGIVESVQETYDALSRHEYIHATPTLHFSGTPDNQLASCFLQSNVEDNIWDMYEKLAETARISARGGGIGINVTRVRAAGSRVKGTNGVSDGIVPFLSVYDKTCLHVNQGGRRKGAFAIYLEPWHADVLDFLRLRLPEGNEDQRARNLFTALNVNDEFMRRLENGENWSLFCPSTVPDLVDKHGEEFAAAYKAYEEQGLAKCVLPAARIWNAAVKSQRETGTPYIMFKDTANAISNQRHVGMVNTSGLCIEIMQHAAGTETAVCTLASVALPKCIVQTGMGMRFSFDKLRTVTQLVTRNLNKVIDTASYPTKGAFCNTMLHRPIGIGVQGLADVFAMLKLPFASEEARQLNKDIFKVMYFAALAQSCELSRNFREHLEDTGFQNARLEPQWQGAHACFAGSPLSEGLFHCDLFHSCEPRTQEKDFADIDRLVTGGRFTCEEIEALRQDVIDHGTRNSLCVALMPTQSTSHILGNNECFEPFCGNIYQRRLLSGEFVFVNKHLVADLQRLNLWSRDIYDMIINEHGSVQNIPIIPDKIREIYKTVWEIPQKVIIDFAADRAPYVDQSQSMNLFFLNSDNARINSALLHAWKSKLKTGVYYVRTENFDVESVCESCSG